MGSLAVGDGSEIHVLRLIGVRPPFPPPPPPFPLATPLATLPIVIFCPGVPLPPACPPSIRLALPCPDRRAPHRIPHAQEGASSEVYEGTWGAQEVVVKFMGKQADALSQFQTEVAIWTANECALPPLPAPSPPSLRPPPPHDPLCGLLLAHAPCVRTQTPSLFAWLTFESAAP